MHKAREILDEIIAHFTGKEINREYWFELSDVLKKLGVTEGHLSALRQEKAYDFIEIDGKEYIHESGLYFLALFISEVEIARKFQRWVFGEVLPSVKNKGFYKL